MLLPLSTACWPSILSPPIACWSSLLLTPPPQYRMELQSSLGALSGSNSPTAEARRLPSPLSSSSGSSSTEGEGSISGGGGVTVYEGGTGLVLLPGEEQYAPGVQKRNVEVRLVAGWRLGSSARYHVLTCAMLTPYGPRMAPLPGRGPPQAP